MWATPEWMEGRFRVNRVTGCWLWTGKFIAKNKGRYLTPVMKRAGKRVLVSREVWLDTRGSECENLVCHTCDNPMCVNPKHLKEGTPQDNSNDMVERGRSLPGERNPAAKLTRVRVKWIVKHKEMGVVALAAKYGVSTAAVSHVLTGKTWSNVTGITYERKYQHSDKLRGRHA